MSTTTLTSIPRKGIPDEITDRLRSYIREYRALRENELVSMKRNMDMSQRVQSAYKRWNRLQTLKSVRKIVSVFEQNK